MTPPLSKQSPCPRQAGDLCSAARIFLCFSILEQNTFRLTPSLNVTIFIFYHLLCSWLFFIIIFFVRLSFHRWLAVIIMSPMSPSIIRHKTSLQLILTRSYVEFPKTKHSDFLMFLFPKPLSTCVGNCGCWRPAAELTNANHHKTAAEPN